MLGDRNIDTRLKTSVPPRRIPGIIPTVIVGRSPSWSFPGVRKSIPRALFYVLQKVGLKISAKNGCHNDPTRVWQPFYLILEIAKDKSRRLGEKLWKKARKDLKFV
jgi:hypothetical protein